MKGLFQVYNIIQLCIDHLGLQDDTLRARYKCLCPFHHDTHPSLYVDNEGRYRCYACGSRGDIFKLMAHLYGIDGLPLLDILNTYWCEERVPGALLFGEEADVVIQSARYLSNLHLAQQIVAGERPHSGMKDNWANATSPAMHYMLTRGYYASTLEHFHVVVWDALQQYPLMIPLIFNAEVYGFQLRAYEPYITPKYLTMPGVHKADHLYGEARIDEPLLIVEGTTDAFMAYQYGYTNVVYTMGAWPSQQQCERIRALRPSCILSGYDNDASGAIGHTILAHTLDDLDVRRILWPKNDAGACGRREFWEAINQFSATPKTGDKTWDKTRGCEVLAI